MKSKKVITLSLSDLKDLGIIPRKNKNKNKKRKRRVKVVLVDPNTGAIIGGAKSDSSHMVGTITQNPQFTNTSNISSAIQEENLKAIERANRKAEQEVKKEEESKKEDEVKQADEGEPKPDPYKLLLGYEDRFNKQNETTNKVIEITNNLFKAFNPQIERLTEGQERQNLINDRGFNAINRITRKYYDITDNVGFNNSSVSSDTLQNQGNDKPIETTNKPTRFETPVPKTTNKVFDAKLNERDDNQTPEFLSESTKKQLRDMDELLANKQNDIDNEKEEWEEMPDEEVKPKIEQSPYTKELKDKLAEKGRGNKLTKPEALDLYKKLGGTDPGIINSKHAASIISVIKALLSERDMAEQLYIKAGGNDPVILNAYTAKTITKAYKKLLKNK